MHSSPSSGSTVAGHDPHLSTSPPLSTSQPFFLFHEKQSRFEAAAWLTKFGVQMLLSVLCSLWFFQRKLLLILPVLLSE